MHKLLVYLCMNSQYIYEKQGSRFPRYFTSSPKSVADVLRVMRTRTVSPMW